MAARCPVEVVVPRPALCTDNAAMIGAAAYFHLRQGARYDWDVDVVPNPQPGLAELSARHTPHTLESGPGQHLAISWAICWLRARIESSSQADLVTNSPFRFNTACF